MVKVMKAMKTKVKYNLTEVDAYVHLSDDGVLTIIPEEPTECIKKIEIPGAEVLFK